MVVNLTVLEIRVVANQRFVNVWKSLLKVLHGMKITNMNALNFQTVVKDVMINLYKYLIQNDQLSNNV